MRADDGRPAGICTGAGYSPHDTVMILRWDDEVQQGVVMRVAGGSGWWLMMGDQLGHALEQGITFMILFGDDEVQQGVVRVGSQGRVDAGDIVHNMQQVKHMRCV